MQYKSQIQMRFPCPQAGEGDEQRGVWSAKAVTHRVVAVDYAFANPPYEVFPEHPLVVITGRGDEAMLRADVPVIHVLTLSVMPGLVPGIHVLTLSPQEGRGWPGHRREWPRPAMTEMM